MHTKTKPESPPTPLRPITCSHDAWNAMVAAHPAGHLLQTSPWGALKARFGWETLRLVHGRPQQDGAEPLPVAGAQMLLRRSAGLALAYIPRGPLVDWSDSAQSRAVLNHAAALAQEQGAAVLKIEPELLDTPENRARLLDLGFRPSRQTVQPPSTIRIDIGGDEDTILQRMKSKWRYNIRLAERKGVTVRRADRADLDAFNALMHDTGERDAFTVHAPAYYAAAFDLFVPDMADFLLAEYQGRLLAGIAVFAVGDTAWYLWGASSNRERNRMPNHALQWAAMRWARDRGAVCYDLWGIPDPVGQIALGMAGPSRASMPADAMPVDINRFPQGDLWGVFRFKQGFGGHVVRCVGAWDKPLSPLGFRLYQSGVAAQEARRTVPARVRTLVTELRTRVDRSTPPAQGHLVTDPVLWRDELDRLPDPHVLQSWEWGQVKSRTGWQAERLLLHDDQGNVRAAGQFLWREPVAGAPFRIGYVPKGPVADWTDPDQAEWILAQVEAHAAALGCCFVKIDPDVNQECRAGRQLVHTLFRRGWRYSDEQIQFKNTAFTLLQPDEETLLAGMKSKWRYNIRLAGRRGIQVRQGSVDGPVDDLAAFYALYAETGARDGFLIRPLDYYRTAWETFLRAQHQDGNPAGGALLLAEHGEESDPVAGLFLMRYRDRAWYFYGASSERRRRDMPNYLLQWEALRWAKAHGCTVYDWWGAPTHPDDPDDNLQGVWQFKQGFGAEFQPHIGAWDFVVSPVQFALYSQAAPRALDLLRRLRPPA